MTDRWQRTTALGAVLVVTLLAPRILAGQPGRPPCPANGAPVVFNDSTTVRVCAYARGVLVRVAVDSIYVLNPTTDAERRLIERISLQRARVVELQDSLRASFQNTDSLLRAMIAVQDRSYAELSQRTAAMARLTERAVINTDSALLRIKQVKRAGWISASLTGLALGGFAFKGADSYSIPGALGGGVAGFLLNSAFIRRGSR